MKILSLDTSFSFLNFSVIEDGRIVLLHYLDNDKKTLENLPKVLKDLCISPEEFDAFAVSVGVGYLTSLRIGVTFMKTLAYILKKPIVSFQNLELIAENTPLPYPKIAYLKISNNILYQVFTEKGKSEIKIYSGEEIEGYGVSLKMFEEIKLGTMQFFHEFFPFSTYGGLKAYRFLRENPEGENLFQIEPIYVKPPV